MLRKGIFILFFISGFTGLLYEVVWTRLFGLVFGNTTLAISTVLSAYMLGLASGSIIIGKKTDRINNYIKFYAFLEWGVGLGALLVVVFYGVLGKLFAFFYFYLHDFTFLFRLIQFIVAFLIMFPATFFMGGTLPLLSHVAVEEEPKIGQGVGQLYGINTLGAVLGCFTTGFFLIRIVGVFQTVYLAVLTNFLVGFAALILYRFSLKRRSLRIRETSSSAKRATNKKGVIAIWAMAISGFVALSYEVLWSRILVFVLTNSVFAFSVMLTTFLLGIGLGGFIGGRWVDRSKKPLSLLGFIECIIGISGFIAGIILVNLGWIHDTIFPITPRTSWWYWNGIRFLEAFFVMFLPTLFIGMSFPVAARIVIPQLRQIGSGLGKLYFYNTLGGVVGSFIAGFVFITFLGASYTLVILVLVNIFLGLYLLQIERRMVAQWIIYILLLPSFLLSFVIISVFLPSELFTTAYSHVEKGTRLVDYREGIEGTVTVHRTFPPFEPAERIDVDGLNVAGSSFMLRTLQILQGELPFLVNPDAKNVVQIGFGTGQTTHSVLLHQLKNFKLIEISKDVLELGTLYFGDLNYGVVHYPNFHYRILDGKNYMKYTRNHFDIVMNDANYAVATSSASLFTKEHFENCKKKLVPGGILSTWMTVDLAPADFAIVLKTFQTVFPYCTLWMAPNCINKQVVLIGSTKPLHIDFQKAKEMFDNPLIKKDLASVNINSVYDILSCLVLDSRGINALSKNAAVNTDNHPILEFSQNSVRSRDMCAYQNIGKILIRRPDIKKVVVNLPKESAERRKIEEKLNRYFYASNLFLKGILEGYQGHSSVALKTLMKGSRIIPESKLASHFFQDMDRLTREFTLEALRKPNSLAAQLNLVRQKIALSRFADAVSDLKRIHIKHPYNASVNYEIAQCYFSQSKLDSAEIYIKQALAVDPNKAVFWYMLGEIKRRTNDFDQALQYLRKALRFDPKMYQSYNSIAAIYRAKNRYQKAAKFYKASLDIVEFQPGITADMAYCYLRTGNFPASIYFYKKAISTGLNDSETFFHLGNAYYLNGDFQEALNSFQQALRYDSTNGEIFYNLGNTYVMKKQFSKALKAYEKAITLNIHEPDYFNNLAMVYETLGQTKKALRIFREGLKYHPHSKLLKKNFENMRKRIEK